MEDTAPVSVFVRVRPMLRKEEELGEQMMEGLAKRCSEPGKDGVAVETKQTKIGGFSGVLGPEADNKEVFERVFQPSLERVANGGTASLFCYGYTGSGKTHTVLGSSGQEGLYRQAAGALLEKLGDNPQLFLVATACELYGEKVFDLLGEEKLPCTLRADSNGNMQVCGPGQPKDLREIVSDFPGLGEVEHTALVTCTVGLRHTKVYSLADLEQFSASALNQRVVGSSSEHEASSRSHAVLKIEVMDLELCEAREKAEEARSVLPAVLNVLDKHNIDGCNKEKGEWERVRAELIRRREAAEKAQEDLEERVRELQSRPGLGGCLLLVDLAGADYDKRDLETETTVQERKESIAINKSLLALKECFRSIGSGKTSSRACFRGSSLTRVLEDALLPSSSSLRRGRDCRSVMVVNVSPSARIEKRTLNVLRYGQMFSDSTKAKKTSKKKAI